MTLQSHVRLGAIVIIALVVSLNSANADNVNWTVWNPSSYVVGLTGGAASGSKALTVAEM
jgi:hypothetical protein